MIMEENGQRADDMAIPDTACLSAHVPSLLQCTHLFTAKILVAIVKVIDSFQIFILKFSRVFV